MFIAGFAAARYRTEIGPATSAIVAGDFAAPVQFRAFVDQYSVGTAAGAESAIGSTAPSTATAASAEPEWLARVNYYRAMAKLPPIVEDPALSKGDRAHTMYIVKNYHDAIAGGGGLGAEMHTEDPGKPNFTPEGLEAAKSSDMDVWSMRGASAGDANRETDGARRPGRSTDGWRCRSIACRYSIRG